MATPKDARGRNSGEAEQIDVPTEKERVVDPPAVRAPSDTEGEQKDSLVTVNVVGAGTVVSPSGATFVLAPGTTLKVLQSDVEFLVSQGHVSTES